MDGTCIAVPAGYGMWMSREEAGSLSDQVVCSARALADPPYGDAHTQRHLPLLFNLFHTYAMLGLNERHQLLRVTMLFITLECSLSLYKFSTLTGPVNIENLESLF